MLKIGMLALLVTYPGFAQPVARHSAFVYRTPTPTLNASDRRPASPCFSSGKAHGNASLLLGGGRADGERLEAKYEIWA